MIPVSGSLQAAGRGFPNVLLQLAPLSLSLPPRHLFPTFFTTLSLSGAWSNKVSKASRSEKEENAKWSTGLIPGGETHPMSWPQASKGHMVSYRQEFFGNSESWVWGTDVRLILALGSFSVCVCVCVPTFYKVSLLGWGCGGAVRQFNLGNFSWQFKFCYII